MQATEAQLQTLRDEFKTLTEPEPDPNHTSELPVLTAEEEDAYLGYEAPPKTNDNPPRYKVLDSDESPDGKFQQVFDLFQALDATQYRNVDGLRVVRLVDLYATADFSLSNTIDEWNATLDTLGVECKRITPFATCRGPVECAMDFSYDRDGKWYVDQHDHERLDGAMDAVMAYALEHKLVPPLS